MRLLLAPRTGKLTGDGVANAGAADHRKENGYSGVLEDKGGEGQGRDEGSHGERICIVSRTIRGPGTCVEERADGKSSQHPIMNHAPYVSCSGLGTTCRVGLRRSACWRA